MTVQLQCLSHTPVMSTVDIPPTLETRFRSALVTARSRYDEYAPDLIVVFAPDHFNGVLYNMMPPFCIGACAESLGDYGTATGPLRVPTALAARCGESVLDSNVDVAVSYRLLLDHGFAQPLELITGGIDRCEVLPIFINCIAKPLPPTRRVRLLGDAVGRFLARECADKRILILGSGGLSHDPPVPSLSNAPAPTRARLIRGAQRTPEEQRAHEDRIVGAARAFAAADASVGGGNLLPLNPHWDKTILELLIQARFDGLDALSDSDIGSQGGSGGHEIRAWIAAFACLAAFGPYTAAVDFYAPIPDWIAGFAMAHGKPTLEHPH